jgi:esterase
VPLSYSWVGEKDAPRLGFATHGVLGAGHNLRSFVRRLLSARPDFRFALVDLRLHGKSAKMTPPHNLEACVDDFLELEAELGIPDVVLGHSLGGKVALCYAARVAAAFSSGTRTKPGQVWALDSDPGAQIVGATHQVKQVLAAARNTRVPGASRDAIVSELVAQGLSSGLSHWLATNLDLGPSGYVWKLDFDAIEELLSDYFSRDLWPFLDAVADGRIRGPELHLVVAENSDRWSGSMKEHASLLGRSKHVQVHELKDSGHWVHVDNPEGLAQILLAHLPGVAP